MYQYAHLFFAVVPHRFQDLEMRERFRHFFRPSDDELSHLWKSGIFSLDASVLLNVYGYSSETSEKLLSLLESLVGRIWLPHQFGLEFARDRSTAVIKQVSNYLDAEKAFQNIKDQFLAPKRDHPFLSSKSTEAFDQICVELVAARRRMESLIGNDPYLERLLPIFEAHIGKEPSAEELSKIHIEAKERFEMLIPPGYEDLKEKDVPQAYGDYVGWVQLVEIAKVEKKGVIFVIDDFKPDWWLIEKKRTVGPRPELVCEFRRATGMPLFMYTSENFLRAATVFTSFTIDDRSLEEVSERLARQLSDQRVDSLKPPGPGKLVNELDAKAGGIIGPTDASEAKPQLEEAGVAELKPVEDLPKASKPIEE